MAPIEPDLSNSNVRPFTLLGVYVLFTAGLTALISYDVLYKAFKALPPSQDTRHRSLDRKKHVQLFAVLAVISVVTISYHAASYLTLSYRVWAHEMGQELPRHLWNSDGTVNLALGRWWSDTSILQDASEIVIEKNRRFWWTQQLFLGAAVWSVFVGIEGRRRNIRHLWAFLLLGQTIAISFALNLFFLAVLLTPIPLPKSTRMESRTSSSQERAFSSKSSSSVSSSSLTFKARVSDAISILRKFLPPLITRPHPAPWTPHPLAIVAPLFVACVSTFLLPFTTSTPTFTPMLFLASFPLYQVLYLDRLAPLSYGSTDSPHRTYTSVYKFLSYASLIMFLKQTFVALLDNDPGAHEHRHSQYLAKLHLPHEQERSALARSGSALRKVLGALGDHPAVAQIGWDVLLCAVSLAIWAVIRGVSVAQVLVAAGLGPVPPSSAISTSVSPASDAPKTLTRRRRKSATTTTEPDSTAAEKDSTYHPTPATESATIAASEEEQPANLEAGAIGGALFALGGLGVLFAGVLGAREVG